MDLSAWSLAQLGAKLLIYGGVAAAVGGPFSVWLSGGESALVRVVRRYGLALLIPALLASAGIFFIQVGALAETGFSGMWDPVMRQIIWQTNAGPALVLRLIAFASLLFLVAVLPSWLAATASPWRKSAGMIVCAADVVLLAISFAIVGHTTELNLFYQLTTGLHVIAMAWWIGSLWPLRRACFELEAEPLYRLMHRFGRYAVFVVGLLIACGGLLAWQLLESWQALLAPGYGRVLLTKLVFVVVILSLAAAHKFALTPQLRSSPDGHQTMAASIAIEAVVAVTILATTSVLTTLVGPGH